MRILNMTPLVFLNLFHRSLSRRNTTFIRTLLLCILAYDSPQMNQTNDSHTVGFVLGLASQLVSKYCWCIVRGAQHVTQGRKNIEGSLQRTKTQQQCCSLTTAKAPLHIGSFIDRARSFPSGSPPLSTSSSSLCIPFA